MRLTVRVTPRAARDVITGFDELGAVRVRVTAAPAGGAANAAVTKLLAKRLMLPQRAVVLVRGGTNREKVFEIDLDEEAVRRRLSR